MSDVKAGTDRRGPFVIRYGGPRGITWMRGAAAERYLNNLEKPTRAGIDGVTSAMNAASGVVGSIATVAEAVGSLLQWWELRQARLHREVREETDARLGFVHDLLDRWTLAHSPIDHVDLELSHYLAREALGLLRHAGSNKVLIPQSLLYELERVRQIIGEMRNVIARQFLALEASGVHEIASPVEGATPLRVNYSALAQLFESPQDAWDRAVGEKDIKNFEKELHHLSRYPREIIAKVFAVSTTDVDGVAASLSPIAQLLGTTERGSMALNISRAALGVMVSGTAAATFVLPFIERYLEEKEIERKDTVRELVLFASEVERARVLLRAWIIIDQTVRATQGEELLCLEDSDGHPIIAVTGEDGAPGRLVGDALTERRLPALVRSSNSSSLLLTRGDDAPG